MDDVLIIARIAIELSLVIFPHLGYRLNRGSTRPKP